MNEQICTLKKMCLYILLEKFHLISPLFTIDFTPLYYPIFHSHILHPYCSFLFYKLILLPNFNPSILPNYFTPTLPPLLVAFFISDFFKIY